MLSHKQKSLARHALGLDGKQKVSYRNRYCAVIGTEDCDEWLKMAKEGYASGNTNKHLPLGTLNFYLTSKGALLALEEREMLSSEDFPMACGITVEHKLATKPQSKMSIARTAVLVALYQGHSLVKPKDATTPKWNPRWKGCPSLRDDIISSLFRSDLITMVDENIVLTPMGKIVAAEEV